MQTLLRLVAAALLILVLGKPELPVEAAAAPFKIDAILSLTGNGSFLGVAQAHALELVQSYVNDHGGVRGRPIEFVIHDDGSLPQTAVQLFNEAVQGKPNVIIGAGLTATCRAIAPLLHDGPVAYCTSAGMRPPTGSYMFAYGVSTAGIMRVLTTYFRGQGWTRLGTIFATDASGQDGEESLARVLERPENRSFSVVDREHYNITDVDVGAQLVRLKASNPQVIIAWATGAPFGTVLRDAHDLGLHIPFATSAANLDYNLMKQYAGYLPDSLYMAGAPGLAPSAFAAGPLKNAAKTFFDVVKGAGMKPESTMIDSWDPAMLVVSALQKLGLDAKPEQIREYLAGLHGFSGAAGIYDFRDGSQRGLTGNTSMVVRFDSAKEEFVPVSGIGGALLAH